MAKTTCPDIAQRAYAEIAAEADRRGTSVRAEIRRLGLAPSAVYKWRRAEITPGTMYLQIMAWAGYDTRYILTGDREAV
jgi:hypothetical protein